MDYTYGGAGLDGIFTLVGSSQSFNRDGSRQSPHGEIKTTTGINLVESWLDSPSGSFGEGALKVGGNILYSAINSPKVLLTGKSWAGTVATGNEKTDAFIDVAPGVISFGLTRSKEIIKVPKKGLEGYNRFVKEMPNVTTTSGLPQGTTWQQRAGRLFRTNRVNQGALEGLNAGAAGTGVVKTVKDELEK